MEQDEAECGQCANSKNEVYYSTDSIEVDIGDEIPLIRRQQSIVAGASMLMVDWVSHVTKILLSGLVTSAVFVTVLILYVVVVKAEDPSRRNIFFFDLSENIKWEKLCATESLVRLHPSVPSYFYLTSDPTPALNLLSDIYPNFYVRRWNWMIYIRETPMEPWSNHLEHLRSLLYTSSEDVLEMTARALTLWKYGGTSTSLGKIHEDECGWVMDIGGNPNIVDESDGTFINFDPCHVLIEKVIQEIMNEVENGKTINSTELLPRQLRRLCQDPKMDSDERKECLGISILKPHSKCPVKPSDYISGAYCPRIQSFSGFKMRKGDKYEL